MATAEDKKKKGMQDQATTANAGQAAGSYAGNNPQAGQQAGAQYGGAQAQQMMQQPKMGWGARFMLFMAKWAWYLTKQVATLSWKFGKGLGARLFHWVRPYAEDLFFNFTGQKGTVVVVRDRVTNEEIERIIFDRKGRTPDGKKLDMAAIMERYKKEGIVRDVEINLYSVPDITYYQVIKDKPLEKSQLSETHILREEMWNAQCKGAKGMDAAYRAFNRNQDIRYIQAEFKRLMDSERFYEAFDMLRDIRETDKYEGNAKLMYLFSLMDENRGDWIKRMSESQCEDLLSVLREYSGRLYAKNISDYNHTEMATLDVVERVYVRVLAAQQAENRFYYDEASEWVDHSLSRFDLEQEWAAKKGKFWKLDSYELWSLCMWANDCGATDILNQQAELLLTGVADVADVSQLLHFFEKGSSPVSLYLHSVGAFQQANSTEFTQCRNRMWELYRHPEVQAIELAKLSRMLTDKTLKGEDGSYHPDKLREIARVYANLRLAGVTDLSEKQEKLKGGIKVLESLKGNELFMEEYRRAVNIKGKPTNVPATDNVTGQEAQPEGAPTESWEPETPQMDETVPFMDLECQSGVQKDDMIDMPPTEEELAEQTKRQGGQELEEFVEVDVVESRPPLSKIYSMFDKGAPDRPELVEQLGLANLSAIDPTLPRTTVEHLWSEAMALCKGMLTPQQIRDDHSGVSWQYIVSNDREHDIESTLDKLIRLYEPFMEELAVANEMGSAEELVASLRNSQLSREVDQVTSMGAPQEMSDEVRRARQTADCLLRDNKPDIPEDFFAVLFDFPFPTKAGMQKPMVQQAIEQANQLVAMADAVKNNMCDPDMLMTLYKEESNGIRGNKDLQTAEEVIAAIEQLKADYPNLRAEFIKEQQQNAQKTNRSKTAKR